MTGGMKNPTIVFPKPRSVLIEDKVPKISGNRVLIRI